MSNSGQIPTHTILAGMKGKYVIGPAVGRGGVGTVYRARATASGDDVAIKVLHGERFGLTDAARARMRQEIVIATEKINSNFVVRGLDHGTFNDDEFLVMEWMDRGTLSSVNGLHLPQPDQHIRWIAHLLKGFRDVRDAGYVHRDIKTNNVLLSASGVAKLADLGLALSQADMTHLTLPEDQIGSLLYISERQRQNPSSVDSGDDFYSLCVVMYELLSGRRYHTRNPALRILRPTGIPLEMLQLIDWGIEQRVEWNEVFAELGRCIDLETERLDANYPGSSFCPIRIVDRKVREVIALGNSRLAEQVAHESQTLLNQIANCIERGFDDAAERIQDSGLRPHISFNGVDLISFATTLSPELYAILKRFGQDEQYGERGYGWLTFETHDAGICCDCLNGKRLSVGNEHLPDDWGERIISQCDEVSKDWLFRLGYGLAVEAVLSALQYVSELIEMSVEAEDADK